MYNVGQKIIYGENGVCIVESIAPLEMSGTKSDKLYYHLKPLIGSGVYFAPVDTPVFMRTVMDRETALAFIDAIPGIEPAICEDTRFNHVDAFYKELFKLHTPEAMVAIIKGLYLRTADKKTKSTRAESTIKRAKDILHGELSVALDQDLQEIDALVKNLIYSNL